MDEKEVSENTEAGMVLVATTASAITGFVIATPIPIEWKTPIAALSTAITTGILAYWKAKINKKSSE